MKKILERLFLLGLIATFAGCSTPESRIKENQAFYDSLPASQQDAILKSQVVPGMSKDAVYLSLGKPDRIVRVREGNTDKEYWVYTKLEPTFYHSSFITPLDYGYYHGFYNGFGPYQDYQEIPVARINFQGDKVIGWERLVSDDVS